MWDILNVFHNRSGSWHVEESGWDKVLQFIEALHQNVSLKLRYNICQWIFFSLQTRLDLSLLGLDPYGRYIVSFCWYTYLIKGHQCKGGLVIWFSDWCEEALWAVIADNSDLATPMSWTWNKWRMCQKKYPHWGLVKDTIVHWRIYYSRSGSSSTSIWLKYSRIIPYTWDIKPLYLERNLIFSSIKNLIMFQILPDVRNWEQKQILI